jgi:hypothetical protein
MANFHSAGRCATACLTNEALIVAHRPASRQIAYCKPPHNRRYVSRRRAITTFLSLKELR